MLAHVLSGAIDSSGLRYLLLLTELVDMSPWRVNQEFTVWASTVFDFLKVKCNISSLCLLISVSCSTLVTLSVYPSFHRKRK